MPKFNRTTHKAEWTADVMSEALRFIRDGGSIRAAGRRFNIPESSIRKRKLAYQNGLQIAEPRLGKQCVFTQHEEMQLKEHVLKLAKLYHGLTKKQLRQLAFSYAEANNIKHNFNAHTKMAGKDWYYGFLKRNPAISLRKPEATSLNRITSFNKGEVTTFFKNLKTLYDRHNFRSDRIFNVDETGITTVHKPCKKLGPRGIKQFGAKTSGERGKTVTVICCYNASGSCFIAPMFIFSRIRMSSTLTKNGPANAIYSCSKSGWSNDVLFYQWLQHFKSIVKPSIQDPVLLIMDNHSSHISLTIFDFCRKYGIILLTIPPHTSNKLQPLDLTFYGPLKTSFNRQCDYHLITNERVLQSDLAEIFGRSYNLVVSIEKAQSGFRTSGIWPYNPDIFSHEDFLAADHLLTISTDDPQPSTSLQLNKKDADADKENNVNVIHIDVRVDHDTLGEKSSNTTFDELSPLPKPSQIKNNSRQKQKSEILTESPNRGKLVDSANRRQERKRNLEDKQKKVPKNKCAKSKSGTKRSLFADKEEVEEVGHNHMTLDSDTSTKCLICDDGIKKKEIWYRCSICSGWAHALCTSANSPEGYICDFCDI